MTNIISVAQLVRYAKSRFDQDPFLLNVLVKGELSNLTLHQSGHVYFTLKDDKSRINCVMFASALKGQRFNYEVGQEVVVSARLSIFETSGAMQLYINQIKLAGIGDLYQQYEMLKEKLQKEGYFDLKYKKPLPTYPFSIGIIAGQDTAALKDIISTLVRRWPVATRYLYHSLVQGSQASFELIKRLKEADQGNHDVLIIARGGGSIEDLWAFNDENLIKTIFQLKTPIISGVGHESDLTLTDLAVDLRAPTPTGAAEVATLNLDDVFSQLLEIKKRFYKDINASYSLALGKLNHYKNYHYFLNPSDLYNEKRLKLMYYNQKFVTFNERLNKLKNNLDKNFSILINSLKKATFQEKNKLDYFQKELFNLITRKIDHEKKEIKRQISILDAYSPLNTLKRGYSITSKDQVVIKSINDVTVGDLIETKIEDGKITSQVTAKEKK